MGSPHGDCATSLDPGDGRPVLRRVAFWTLIVFLAAVLAALVVTLSSVPPSAQWVAGVVVVPIVGVTALLLWMERSDRRWSYGGAALLGAVGITLRLVVSTRPSLEVGGGLPPVVTVAYVALGALVVGTSLASFLRFGRPNDAEHRPTG
jgi:hypothetical protein